VANIKILGISGSLRKASFNRLALKAAQGLVPAGATIEAIDLPDLPGFNQDNEKTPPAAVSELKAKIRALTHRTSQLDLEYVLTRLNQVMHGWANYFRHAVAKNAFAMLDNFAWWRVIRMLMVRHRWRWKDVRRRFTGPSGRWLPVTAGNAELRHIAAIPVTRYRYRGSQIPNPWAAEPA